MQKQTVFFLALILFLGIGCKKINPPKANIQADFQKILDARIDKYKQRFPGKNVGFGLYVKSSGGNSHGQAAISEYASAGIPGNFGANIHFRGASTTKTFTMASILLLAQQNKLKLDDLITANIPGTSQPYIPATSDYDIPNKNKITIRLLLQHRAGVFDVTNTDIPKTANAPYAGRRYADYAFETKGDDHTFNFRELISVVAQNNLSYFEPGTSFHYSNTGYNVLGTIIERVSGKRYDQFLQDNFLNPLELYNTYFPYLGTDQKLPNPSVKGWARLSGNFFEISEDNVSGAVSEGNIITTPKELATWCNALFGSYTLINPDLHAQMIRGIPTNEQHVIYGMGTELNPPDIGYGHNGARAPYMTVMKYHPGTNTSYVLFTNFLDVDDVYGQQDDLEDIVRDAIRVVQNARN